MKNSISTSLDNVIKNNIIKKEDFNVIKGYYDAIKTYETLVSNGLAIKRGNTLKTLGQENKVNITFNTLN